MKKLLLLFLLLSSWSAIAKNNTSDKLNEKDMGAYLMVYHKDCDHSLHMAISYDGYTWTSLNNDKPIIAGDTISMQHGIRDPHIFRGPDGGFYLAMTDLNIWGSLEAAAREGHKDVSVYRDTEWERDGNKYGWGNNRGLVLMKSYDLKNWTRTNLDFSKLPPQPEMNWSEVGCVWAPETVYDEENKQLMVHFTTREGNGKNSIFYVNVNDDFTEMTGKPMPLFEAPGRKYSVIDSDIIKVGDTYHLFFVSHEHGAAPVHATGKKVTGPYQIDELYNDNETGGHEAPNCWKRIGEEKYVLMFDNFSLRPHNFGFVETTDFKTFTPVGHFDEEGSPLKRTNFSEQKHGAVIWITRKEAARLLGAYNMDNVAYESPVSEAYETMEKGVFEPTWESLSQYNVPEWFRDAKFGIWAHWGPQCVEGSGDWMAREMYMEGTYKGNFHREHYGHPSEFGFKDVLPLFKAENWNPDELVRFYAEECGAQYFFALGNHHDNFDLWNSKYQEWNSMNIGPKKDLLEGWAKAAKKAGIPFGISFHADHAWSWYEPSRRFDLKGDKRGVLYDGWLTKEDGYKPNADGSEKWWKGLDPQNLYAQNHDVSPKIWDNGGIHSQWGWGGDVVLPTSDYITNFYNRTLDAINRYNPDLIYFDVTVLPFYPVSDAGMKITAHLYNHHQATKGNPGVVFGKILNEEQKEALVWDVERGAPNRIMERPWQCCNCIGDWHYNTGTYLNNHYKTASMIVKLLVDIVSKNGNMLLSVPLRADGTPDEKEIAIMKQFASWMKVNKESIVATRPWKKFGEGPIAESSIQINAQGFNDGNYTKAGSNEIRFTQSKDGKTIYATALEWPDDMTMRVKSLATQKIRNIELLGYGRVKFEQTENELVVALPEKVNDIAPVIKIKY